jgi:threonine/homoserine/homoserine lactone efflux protein
VHAPPISLFVKGLFVGFFLAAPVGPIAALVIQRTIAKRWLSGFITGLGAATADAIYGALAAFGATFVTDFLIKERSSLQHIGGAILILLGIRLLFTRVKERDEKVETKRHAGHFLSTLVLTLTNPMTFIAFAAIFTTMGIGVVRGHSVLTAELVGGVFLGSAAWWTLLCTGARAVRQRFDFRKLNLVNRATGVFVIAVGIAYMLLQKPTEEPRIERLVPRRMRAATPTPR